MYDCTLNVHFVLLRNLRGLINYTGRNEKRTLGLSKLEVNWQDVGIVSTVLYIGLHCII